MHTEPSTKQCLSDTPPQASGSAHDAAMVLLADRRLFEPAVYSLDCSRNGKPQTVHYIEEPFQQEVGNSNYELLESLLQGRELEDVELKELRQAMERHYQPKKLVLAERFGLMSKVQKPGQALHEYYAELQKAANTCSFEEIKNHRDAVVTMVFIGGLLSVDTRKRLLGKGGPDVKRSSGTSRSV
ncbi:hypothetical protein COOONC_12994 [Cooperia oncophora]